jgi:heptosyltransferase-2
MGEMSEMIDKGGLGRILLIRLSSLGDVTLATAALEAIAEELPGVTVDVLVKPAFAEIFAGHPVVAQIITWDEGCSPAAMGKRIEQNAYDWIVDLHANLRTRALRLLVREPRWSVYRKGALQRRAAVKMGRPGWLGEAHVVDRYIDALAPLGISPQRRLPRIHPGVEAQKRAGQLLKEGGWNGEQRLVALAPGARWKTKAWPVEKWVALVRHVAGPMAGVPVLVGGPDEVRLGEDILHYAGNPGVVTAGRTSVVETAAVLEQCDVLVTNDSAPLHLATAVSTPVLAIFGPTVRGFGFYPLGPCDGIAERHLECRPCSLHGGDFCPRGHFRCMEELEAEQVATWLERVLDCAQTRRGGSSP